MGMPEGELRATYARNNPPDPTNLDQIMMRINQLETINRELTNNRLSIRTEHPPRIKGRRPDPFRGEPLKLESFLTATNVFFYLEPENFTNNKAKILDITLNFTGSPSHWI